jgi:hypothetical protein
MLILSGDTIGRTYMRLIMFLDIIDVLPQLVIILLIIVIIIDIITS